MCVISVGLRRKRIFISNWKSSIHLFTPKYGYEGGGDGGSGGGGNGGDVDCGDDGGGVGGGGDADGGDDGDGGGGDTLD